MNELLRGGIPMQWKYTKLFSLACTVVVLQLRAKLNNCLASRRAQCQSGFQEFACLPLHRLSCAVDM